MTGNGPRTRCWWGWGWEESAVAGEELAALRQMASGLVGADVEVRTPPAIARLNL